MKTDVSFDSNESDDPWTFHGSFSKAEVDGAIKLLEANCITFSVIKDSDEKIVYGGADAWSGPYLLWINDQDSNLAATLLVPYFAAGFKDRTEQGLDPND